MTTNTGSNLLEALRATNSAILANANGVRKHGQRFFLTVTGVEEVEGNTYLIGNEPFRGLESIKIHVKDPALERVASGPNNEERELRKFSKLVEIGAVRNGDMVVFKDVEFVPGSDGRYIAHSCETPFNNIQTEEAVKSTSVMTGFVSVEGTRFPQVVLYQTSPSMVGTLQQLQERPESEKRQLLMDGLFMANIRTEADLLAWANSQFTLKRPVTIRAIVAGVDGSFESVGIKVNPQTVEQTDASTQAVYRVSSVDASMEYFLNSKEVQQIAKLLRMAIEGNYVVNTFDQGGQIMIEGIPTLRINDPYSNLGKEYVRNGKGVFDRVSVTLPGANRSVMQDVALQGVLILKNTVVAGPTGQREIIRVGGGSGLLENRTEAYMLSELPTPNFTPSAEMGVLRDHDQQIGANRSVVDDAHFRNIAALFVNPAQIASAASAPKVETHAAPAPTPVATQSVEPVVLQTPPALEAATPQVKAEPEVLHADDFDMIDVASDAVTPDDLSDALRGLTLTR